MTLIELDKMAEYFAVDIIRLSEKLKEKNWESLADWVFYSGTQISINITNSKDSGNPKAFILKLKTAFTRANETLYWINILYDAGLIDKVRQELFKYRCNRIRIELAKAIKKAKETF